jgi:hypothetical protein
MAAKTFDRYSDSEDAMLLAQAQKVLPNYRVHMKVLVTICV